MEDTLLEIPGVAVRKVEGVDPAGRPMVRLQDDTEPEVASVVHMAEPPSWRDCVGLRVAVAATGDPDSGPVVLGLLDPPPSSASRDTPKTLRVESTDELTIACGKARITLRADGRIEIRGGHLISRSSGANKIKGASVEIN